MDDPFLRTHHLEVDSVEHINNIVHRQIFYDISGIFNPIAIRDQIIRASLVIERAIEQRLIVPNERPLLVIGGGFAGIAASYHAVKKNIQTFLVEREDILGKFSLLTRYISPTLYDFPHSHWTNDIFPLHPTPSILVQIQAGTVGQLTETFQTAYFQHLKASGLFEYLQETEVTKIILHQNPSVNRFATATVEMLSTIDSSPRTFRNLSSNFGMVLSCVGFGNEKTWLPHKQEEYNGFKFWEIDFDIFRTGSRTLICGSGDGALQDFLLIVTKENSAREIYEKMNFSEDVRNWIEWNLFRAEDLAQRSALWYGDRSMNQSVERVHNVELNLHRKYLAIVEKLLGTNTTKVDSIIDPRYLPSEITITDEIKDSLINSLEILVDPFFNDGNIINIAHLCNHFTRGYALNRFLALLIIEYIENVLRINILIPNASITSIEGIGHTCNRAEQLDCLEHEHHVKYIHSTCDNLAGGGVSPLITYNQIILRFGLEMVPSPFEKCEEPYENCKAPFRGLQTLPYEF